MVGLKSEELTASGVALIVEMFSKRFDYLQIAAGAIAFFCPISSVLSLIAWFCLWKQNAQQINV